MKQYLLYALAAVPIGIVVLTTLVFYDIMLIMLIDFILVVVLSIAVQKITANSEGLLVTIEEDKLDNYQELKAAKSKDSISFIPIAIVVFLSILTYILLWIAGLSYEKIFFTLEPAFSSATWRWVYWIIFFFLFPTAYSAVESMFYYKAILQNLEGNQIQAVIVGLLAWAKGIVVINKSVNDEWLPTLIIVMVWLVMNLVMAWFAYGERYMVGSISRQISYMLLLIGWILLMNNPFNLNRKPDFVLWSHPKNIFGG